MVGGDVMLRVEDVAREFGGVRAVDGVSLTIRPGTVHSVIGPNAAGKSTLFNLISGELAPTRGRIVLEGRDITGLAPHRVARAGIGRCFQRNYTFPKLAVSENVWAAAFAHAPLGWRSLLRPIDGLPVVGSRVEKVLDEVGLSHKTNAPAATLSHGQHRMLEVAMALAGQPRLLLLDEPTQGLSPAATQQMVSLLQRLAAQYTILLIEHKMDVVMSISHRVSVMHLGQVIAEGTPNEIREDDAARRAYLGMRA
jgi:branched-chain amino acid transport system ATP-binding protein